MKRLALVIAAVAALFLATISPAAADGHTPVLTIEPASVDAAGEHEFTVTGSDFAPTGGFLLPCAGVEGDLALMAESDPTAVCDLGALTPYAPDDDGGWTATVTYDVPAEGLVLAAGDTGGANASAALISIGAAEEAAPAEEVEEEAAPAAADALPATGVESYLFAVVGLAIVAAGALVVRSSREFARI